MRTQNVVAYLIAIAAAWPETASQLLNRCQRMAAVARERRALAALNDRELRDIGVTRDAAAREAARPYWDTPDRPRRWR